MGLFGTKKDVRENRNSRMSSDDIEDLYQSDIDRHLWAIPERKQRAQRRKLTRWLASAAGMLGAVGISWWLMRRSKNSESEDPADAQAASYDEAVDE